MSEFFISKANPIHFRTETGAGTSNAGAYFPDNYLYEDILTFLNCSKLVKLKEQHSSHVYECQGETDIQIRFRRDFGQALIAELWNVESNSLVNEVASTQPYPQQQFYNFNLNFGNLPGTGQVQCPGCYQLIIKRLDNTGFLDTVQWAGNGTFDDVILWSNAWVPGEVGFTNVASRDTVTFQAGVSSALITASAVPVVADATILRTTVNQNFVGNNTFILTGYVREDSVNPFTNTGDIVRWDMSGVTDGINPIEVLWSKNADFSVDGQDVWVEITVAVRTTIAAMSGKIKIVVEDSLGAPATPQANGKIWTDTHSLRWANTITEATSEKISLRDKVDCYQLVEYWNDRNAFQLQLNETYASPRFRYRIESNLAEFKFEDNLYRTAIDSAAIATVIGARLRKLYPLDSHLVPPYLYEIFILSSAFRKFFINNIKYIRKDATVDPEWTEGGTQGQFSADLLLDDYNYVNSNC